MSVTYQSEDIEMTEPQLHTPVAPDGRLNNGIYAASSGDNENMIDVLDDAIPLQGASHADVLDYVVDTPLRYAECFALLTDGRKVGLQNPRTFIGWSQHDLDRSLLFRGDGKYFEVAVERSVRGQAPRSIRQVVLAMKSERRPGLARKFIGVDGDLVVLQAET